MTIYFYARLFARHYVFSQIVVCPTVDIRPRPYPDQSIEKYDVLIEKVKKNLYLFSRLVLVLCTCLNSFGTKYRPLEYNLKFKNQFKNPRKVFHNEQIIILRRNVRSNK